MIGTLKIIKHPQQLQANADHRGHHGKHTDYTNNASDKRNHTHTMYRLGWTAVDPTAKPPRECHRQDTTKQPYREQENEQTGPRVNQRRDHYCITSPRSRTNHPGIHITLSPCLVPCYITTINNNSTPYYSTATAEMDLPGVQETTPLSDKNRLRAAMKRPKE